MFAETQCVCEESQCDGRVQATYTIQEMMELAMLHAKQMQVLQKLHEFVRK